MAVGPRLDRIVLQRLELVRLSSERLVLVLSLHGGAVRTIFVEISEQIADKSSQQQTVAESLAAEDKAIENDPEYADAYFYRGVILAGIKQYSASQADLQLYIVKAPDGTWTNQAHSLLAQVTTALETPSTTVPPTSTTRKKK